MLRADHLTLGYCHGREKLTVIDRLSFSLEEGEILAIAGPSGCGKTTLLNALAGILAPLGGCLEFGGRRLDPQSCSIGFLPQSGGLLPWKTVRANCLFCADLHGLNRKKAESRLEKLAVKLGIGGLLDRYPRTLSGGQAQRTALARAFLMNPDLLLMDEPFAALDIAASAAAGELCLSLCRECRCTGILITHRLEEAFYLADRIAVMEQDGSFRFECQNYWKGEIQPAGPEYCRLAADLCREIRLAASSLCGGLI